MTRISVGFLASALSFVAMSPWAAATGAIESRPVHFAKGASSATLKGYLKGEQTIDYVVRARAGQRMDVGLKTSNSANYFNVLPPGSRDAAVFVGSRDGNDWSGTLTADGEYTIRVYLMRSAARRNETATYTLTVGVTGSGSPAASPGTASAGDAKVKNTPYHATGKVPCSMGSAAPGSLQCEFGVIRGAPGHAEIHLTPPGGFKRVLIFAGGKVPTSEGARVKSGRSEDNWVIEVNDFEHYRIPDAVINGG